MLDLAVPKYGFDHPVLKKLSGNAAFPLLAPATELRNVVCFGEIEITTFSEMFSA